MKIRISEKVSLHKNTGKKAKLLIMNDKDGKES